MESHCATSRTIVHHYSDPLDLIWIEAARRAGIQVVRDPEVNASWDGAGILRIGTRETLDADDSLAQMILHEMCHALVAGPDQFREPDWGLEFDHEPHRICEYAALRLQAALSDPFGLRRFFAATTLHRAWFDGLGTDPMAGDDPSCELARQALARAKQIGWDPILEEAIRATRALADVVCERGDQHSLWRTARRGTGGPATT